MLAEVDPEAAAPAERLRALGNGRWEMRAVIDTECQRGLQQLRELLSHVDPHLTVGQLVGRLVREGLERYDPSRPPRRKRRESTPAGDERSSGTAGREMADRVAAAAENPRRPGKSAAPAVSPSAARRSAKPAADSASPADRWWLRESLGQETARVVAGQPHFGAEARCAACRSRQERRRRGGDGAYFGAEAARGSRRFDSGSEHGGRRIGEADFDGEVPRGNRQFDTGAEDRRRRGADFGGEVPQIVGQIDSGCGETRDLAARSGVLHLRRPG